MSQSNFSLLNSSFGNHSFSNSSKIVPDEQLKLFTEKCNTLEIPYDESDPSNNIFSKYYDINDFKEIQHDDNSDFSLLHLNIASLSKHFDDLQNFLTLLDHKFDIIGITEHKISRNSLEKNFYLPGYKFCFDLINSSYGGTGIFISDKLNFKRRDDLSMIRNEELESTFVEISIPNRKSIICGTIYRHPKMNLELFNNDFLDPMLEKIDKENKICFLMGDFNANLLNVDTNTHISEFLNNFTSHFFSPYILQPTRVNEHSKTLIDNVFINNVEYKSHSGNLTSQISDHLIQFVILKGFKKLKVNEEKNNYKRDYSFFNYNEFKNDLFDLNWNTILEIPGLSANAGFDIFLQTITRLLDEHAPIKKLSKREISLKAKPWITTKISNLMIKRDKIFKSFCKEKNDEVKQKTHVRYKRLRNYVVKLIKDSKKEHYVNFFQKNTNNIRKTWDGIKSLVTLKPKAQTVVNSIVTPKGVISSNRDIAEEFNNFFSSVGSTISSKIPGCKSNFKDFLGDKVMNSFFLRYTDEDEILKIIKNLKSNKSSGPNSIPIHILKFYADIFCKPISKLVNLSFSQGVFPESLKLAKVIPIFKKNDPQICSNYRPISLLSIFSKIYEKCMHSRLYSFFTKYDLIFSRQFGFRHKYSTGHALLSLIELIKHHIENDKIVSGIFIDLEKAFDTVNHKILLSKLEHYGIRGLTLKWLNSYLDNRKQYVFLSGESSSTQPVSCGVPQGSTLGPLLFLIYINDFHKAFSETVVHNFADDTNMLFAGKNVGHIESVVNRELKTLTQWLRSNKLSLNTTKTKFLLFRSPNKVISRIPNIKICKFKLTLAKSVDYLGVTIDEVLSWNKQVCSLTQKLCRANAIISKLRHFVPLNACVSVYYSVFFSHILHGCLVWSYSNQGNIKKLEVLQKRCVRILTFSDFLTHAKPLFNQLNILQLDDVFHAQKLLFMFDVFTKNIPNELNQYFCLNNTIHSYNTRSINLYHIPKVRLKRTVLQSLRYEGPNLWNRFSNKNVQNDILKNKKVFKQFLKTYFLKTY